MAPQAGRLVIDRIDEPPSPEEMAAILHRVYDRLLGEALLTQRQVKHRIKQDRERKDGRHSYQCLQPHARKHCDSLTGDGTERETAIRTDVECDVTQPQLVADELAYRREPTRATWSPARREWIRQ